MGTGSPSKPSVVVIRTGSFSPATSTRYTSKLLNPSLFDANRTYSRDGWTYGAQLMDPKSVSWRWSLPSGFMDQTSATSPSSEKRRQMIRDPSGK